LNALPQTFADKTLGTTFQYAMPFLVCIVLIGLSLLSPPSSYQLSSIINIPTRSLNATLFSGSRYIWASARERHFPSFISCINREEDSPRAALIIHVCIGLCFNYQLCPPSGASVHGLFLPWQFGSVWDMQI